MRPEMALQIGDTAPDFEAQTTEGRVRFHDWIGERPTLGNMLICPRCGQENPEGFGLCGMCGSPLVAPAPQRRKLATLLFCDVSGSTALGERVDAESVRDLMFRYLHEMRGAIERHGGTVEKFVGDAVMAVFGVPVAQEDDALRAVRAAAEMRKRLQELNLELETRFGARLALRIGVNTGEVVAGDSSQRENFVTGDAVNTAARLEQAADPGEILLGELTYSLCGEAIEVERLSPIRAKGKAKPLAAYRLESADLRLPLRRSETPLVGRDEELAALERLFEQIVTERRCLLATIVGEPGVGKSRLASELIARISERAAIYNGRCLSYGEGITFWPLAEIVREAADIRDEHTVEEARNRIAMFVDAPVAERIATLIGLGGELGAEETPWAVRRLLEALARERPLVCLVEDVHWAEPALLDLLEHVTARAHAPILLLLTARPDLLEERPAWPALRLMPLSETEIGVLVARTGLPGKERERVLSASGGNPLFAEELAAFLQEHPQESSLPPSLSALLTARLDRLPEGERAVAERASVEGEVFHRGALQKIADPDVSAALEALVERELVRPVRAEFVGEAAFRFKHALVRDAAYAGLSKRTRAELHERLADWLKEKAGERIQEYEEIFGYHLEQAYRYRIELGPADVRTRALAVQGGVSLGSAGRRAEGRDDMRAATGLLTRALSLQPPDDPDRTEALRSLARAYHNLGELERADEVFGEAIEAAHAAGALGVEWRARLQRAAVRADLAAPAAIDEYRVTAEQAIAELAGSGDEAALSRAWNDLAYARTTAGDNDGALVAAERALEHALRVDDPRRTGAAAIAIAFALQQGATPAAEAARRCHALVESYGSMPFNRINILFAACVCHAIARDFARGRAAIAEAMAVVEEFGLAYSRAFVDYFAGLVERLAGESLLSEDLLRRACTGMESMGLKGPLSTAACDLADLLCERGALVEAFELTEQSREATVASDRVSEIGWRRVQARVLARQGEPCEAVRLARKAVEIAGDTDFLNVQGDALLTLAEVLRTAGEVSEAAEVTEGARLVYERKGNVVMAARAREFLAEARVELP